MPNVQVGNVVKTSFHAGGETEHMWVLVTKVKPTYIIGTLDNDPITEGVSRKWSYGDKVKVPVDNVEQIMNPSRKHLSGDVSAKAQRAYEHIKSSLSGPRRKEIAARTVRKMIGEGRLNPSDTLDSLMSEARNLGYAIYYHPKLGTVSINGAKAIPEREAVIKLRSIIALAKERNVRLRERGLINNGGGRGNPSDSLASEISEGFHGRPPSETIDIDEEEQYTEELGVLGCLVELHITRDDGETSVKLRFPIPTDPKFKDGDEVYLAAPNRTNLEAVGGDQEIVNLDEIVKHTDKNLVRLGQVDKIVYLTDKYHLDDSDGQEAEYVHELGKRKMFGFSKKRVGRPDLIYDVLNKQLKFVGGTYTVTDEGIIN